MRISLQVCGGLLLVASHVAAPVGAATTIVRNVHGYSVAGQQLQQFDSIAFDDGKVLVTGSASDLRHAYPAARVVDGHGCTLLPGLIDAHGHVLALGFATVQLQLSDTRTLSQAQAQIRSYATHHQQLHWLLGAGWNQAKWNLGRFPTAADLDAAVSDRPVALGRVDGHALWLNSAALREASITKQTPDPPGGRIERAADGTPSGVLVDKAMALAERAIPSPTLDQRRAALTAALAHLKSVGITGVGDAGVDADDVELYRSFADSAALPVRVYAMIADTGGDFDKLSASGPLIGYGDDRLTVRAVKLFADGALGSRGAALLEPYTDEPSHKGLLLESDASMTQKIEKALRAGYQVNVHAIGDAANRQVLDAFETAYRVVGGRDLRNRIEHAQIVSPADIPRFKALDIIASMQPTHATSDMNMAEDRLGKDRMSGAYAWRTFLAQGTRIAGGSDFPVESDNPFFGLHAAVTRTDHSGRPAGGWYPEQALTRLEALRAFTLDASYAQHQEAKAGSLEPGKWADFILVDRDFFTLPAADIWKIRVRQTWVGGRRVY